MGAIALVEIEEDGSFVVHGPSHVSVKHADGEGPHMVTIEGAGCQIVMHITRKPEYQQDKVSNVSSLYDQIGEIR